MALKRFLQGTLFIGIFGILFTPLYVPTEMFFPFITGKNFAFRIAVELMLAAWLILMLRDASYRPKKSAMLVAYGALLAILAVADVFGENFYRSFWSNYERMEGLIGHLHLFAYFIIVTSVLTTERLWERFFKTSLGVSVILGIYGLLQLAGSLQIHQGSSRLDATLGNATYLAAYMLFHVFIAALFMAREWGTAKTMRYVYGAVMLLDLFILYYTATRGAILGLIGGTMVALALAAFLHRDNPRVRKWAFGGIAGIVLLAGAFFVFKDSAFVRESPVLSRFAPLSISMKGLGSFFSGECSPELETTIRSRCLIWHMSLEAVKENPLLGYGQENYIVVFNKYYNPEMYAQEPWFDRSHNVFLDWLIVGGIPGLAAYLSLFAIALWYLFKRGAALFSPFEKSIFAGMLAAYFIQNVFVFDNFTSYLIFISVLAYLVFRVEGQSPRSSMSAALAPSAARIYIPAVLVVMLTVLYFGNVKPILASKTLIKALSQQENFDANLALFEKVFAYDTFGSGEAREQLLQAAVRIQTPAVPQETRQKFYELARREMLVQVAENPRDARYELFLGSFLNKFGLYDEAMAHLERARELSPKKQQIFFEQGAVYLSKGDYRKALATFKEAYDFAPDFQEARFLYGLAALYAREDKLASDILVSLYGTLLIPDDRIINAYAMRGEYGKVVELWKQRVAAEPANINYHGSLAASYYKIGRTQDAIAELRKIGEIDPTLKAQVDELVRRTQAGENVFQ